MGGDKPALTPKQEAATLSALDKDFKQAQSGPSESQAQAAYDKLSAELTELNRQRNSISVLGQMTEQLKATDPTPSFKLTPDGQFTIAPFRWAGEGSVPSADVVDAERRLLAVDGNNKSLFDLVAESTTPRKTALSREDFQTYFDQTDWDMPERIGQRYALHDLLDNWKWIAGKLGTTDSHSPDAYLISKRSMRVDLARDCAHALLEVGADGNTTLFKKIATETHPKDDPASVQISSSDVLKYLANHPDVPPQAKRDLTDLAQRMKAHRPDWVAGLIGIDNEGGETFLTQKSVTEGVHQLDNPQPKNSGPRRLTVP
jgi:hypothetical protein